MSPVIDYAHMQEGSYVASITPVPCNPTFPSTTSSYPCHILQPHPCFTVELITDKTAAPHPALAWTNPTTGPPNSFAKPATATKSRSHPSNTPLRTMKSSASPENLYTSSRPGLG